MATLHTERGFAVTNAPHRFDGAREAIDAVSAFEAATLENWEYRLEARDTDDDGLCYLVTLNALTRINGKLVRGYLTPEPARMLTGDNNGGM